MKPARLWRHLLRWSLDAGHREDVDADLAEEFDARITESSPAAARRWYRRQVLGFVGQRLARRGAGGGHRHSARGKPMTERLRDWWRDLQLAARTLRRTPMFTATAVGTLALAIGVTAAMFAVVDKVLIAPLPYPAADRLVHIAASAPGSDMPDEFGVAGEFYLHYREHSTLLEDVSTYNSGTSTLRTPDRVERIRMSFPTPTLFSTLGLTPMLGRLPSEADGDQVAVISHALWTSWFGRDPDIVGKAYSMNGQPRTIVGVMGPEFRFPDDGSLLWIPSPIEIEDIGPGRFGGSLVARLAPGATPGEVATELTALARQLPERFGGTPDYARLIEQHRAVVRPLADEMLGLVARPLWVLLGATGIVLVIACANVANLFAVRAEGRQRDLAVRRAIGASRGQLVRLQMAEATVVALLAAGLAVVLALALLPQFLAMIPPEAPRFRDVVIGPGVMAFTLGLAGFAALACGVGPALRASKPSFTRLREGGRSSSGGRPWVRDSLVAGQTALALLLLIASGLLGRSLMALSAVDPGYDTSDVFTFQIAPDRPELNDGPSFARFNLEFIDRLRRLPGVESVGLVENVPLNEGTASVRFVAEGVVASDEAAPLLSYTFEAGDYFETMRIPVIAGRPLEAADHLDVRLNVVISHEAQRLLWPGGESAIGKRIRTQGGATWYTVVGVVGDVRQYNFRDAPEPKVYLPMVGPTPDAWALSSPAYVIRTPRADAIQPDVRALAREVAPEAPMYRTFTMDELAGDSMVQLSVTMAALAVASGLALILGAVGLYAVLSYIVASRTREIGVRLALGATVDQVRRMIVGQGAQVVLAGVAVGVAVALVATRALGSLLFGVAAIDLPTFLGMSIAMLAVGAAASYLPARRASGVDPIVSLRGE